MVFIWWPDGLGTPLCGLLHCSLSCQNATVRQYTLLAILELVHPSIQSDGVGIGGDAGCASCDRVRSGLETLGSGSSGGSGGDGSTGRAAAPKRDDVNALQRRRLEMRATMRSMLIFPLLTAFSESDDVPVEYLEAAESLFAALADDVVTLSALSQWEVGPGPPSRIPRRPPRHRTANKNVLST